MKWKLEFHGFCQICKQQDNFINLTVKLTLTVKL